MIIHPQFDPVLISIGPLAIRWYALSYIVGFVLFIWLGRRRIAQGNTLFTKEMLDDFLTWGILGVILGGRLGYILFYKLSDYLADPISMLKVWEGGMSFHGGFLGVVVAMWLFSRKHNISVWKTMDFVAPLVPLGLASGRIGNFINGELWGRVTDPSAFWAMGFPQARYEDLEAAAHNPQWAEWLNRFGMLPRHPSQLYQFALEGICLFILVWVFSKKPRPAGQVASLFLGGYGFFRFIAEFARQPDDYLGLLTLGLSMGQWLSVPMIVLGAVGFVYFGKKNAVN
ncbi:prolipoprotein diacylglyceryl transferase [Neisseria sp. N95_16]|uniref:Phosphatidylglycerol--prolipoprotein diacylglyceryl transferase n=1 Tax=Neisseria brasiliensis TaxID=2666100 RepID=A0A5Q3RZW5_9NEIS|nr:MULTISPECIES: prolipoprotein diacylglyceryl transferase [Neisseria]MRN36972.1 prolipoprotein diacylglyceryl transferase [Neisseria brasiliensis]PJO10123.1 prolipoprotein diacylglyceryl transferase [Neisseria sp. N95_16]PJO78353.1 prolipoprotein diacylglyceryl transferase [Neisseria sp. N177_16]QGL24108.1 prolipoprotein diacylglyceryl transferase [Neisseria brasiliensis]